MPLDYAESRRAADARERIAGAKQRLRDLRLQRTTELREAARYRDDTGRLTDQGVRERRDQLAGRVREKYAPQLEQLEAQVSGDLDTLRRAAKSTRPEFGETPIAWSRAQSSWEAAKAKLEAGMNFRQVLATADRDTALAIAEWGPSYAELQAFKSRPTDLVEELTAEPFDSTPILRAAQARLAELDPDYGEYHAAHVQAEGISAHVQPLVQEASGGSALTPLEAALEAHYASQAAEARYAVTAADTAAAS